MSTVLVTGAGGYVGGCFVAFLEDHTDLHVRALSRREHPWATGERVTVDLVADDAVVRLTEAMHGVQAVVHLAAPNETAPDPDVMLRDAVVGARRVAEAARRSGTPRVVYLSTMHVYGAAMREGATLTEQTVPLPRHPYAVGRLASEHLVAADTDAAVLRLTNSVGPPVDPAVDRWTLVANDLARQAVTTGEIRLATSGRQSRDFCAMDDVCRWLLAASDPASVPAGTYNVGAGTNRSILELAAMVADAAEATTGTRPAVIAAPTGPDPVDFRVDVTRAEAAGMRARVPLAHAVEATVRACRRWFDPQAPMSARS